MSFSADLKDSTLNRIFRSISTPLTLPYPPIDIGLWIGSPVEGGAEVSGNGYARKLTELNDWTTSSGGVVSNKEVLSFPEASPNGWGSITHFVLIGAVEREILIYGMLTGLNVIGAHSVPRFAAGKLTITLS